VSEETLDEVRKSCQFDGGKLFYFGEELPYQTSRNIAYSVRMDKRKHHLSALESHLSFNEVYRLGHTTKEVWTRCLRFQL
jgi:hypothetical protein